MDIKENFDLIEATIQKDEITIEEQIAAIDAVNNLMDAVAAIPIGIEEPDDVPSAGGRPIVQKDFKGTGLGKVAIAELASIGVDTVDELIRLGQDEINALGGISDTEAKKIWARANELAE